MANPDVFRHTPDTFLPLAPQLGNVFRNIYAFYPELSEAEVSWYSETEWNQIARNIVVHGLMGLYHFSASTAVSTAAAEVLALVNNDSFTIKFCSDEIPSHQETLRAIGETSQSDQDAYTNLVTPFMHRDRDGQLSLLIPRSWVCRSAIDQPGESLASLIYATSYIRDLSNGQYELDLDAAGQRALGLAAEVLLQASKEAKSAEPKSSGFLDESSAIIRAAFPKGISSANFDKRLLYSDPKFSDFDPVLAFKPRVVGESVFTEVINDLDFTGFPPIPTSS